MAINPIQGGQVSPRETTRSEPGGEHFASSLARFMREAAKQVPYTLRAVSALPHTFDPVGTTPQVLRRYQDEPTWKGAYGLSISSTKLSGSISGS